MKPKDLLNWRLEQFVIPSAEALDFRYLESQRRFKRKMGDLNQVIGIELRSRNYEDSCAFSVGFHFESKGLQKWRDQHLKGNPYRKYHRDFVWGGSDYRIPDWPQKEVKRFFGLLPPRKGVRRHFHLTNSSDDVTEMQVLKECIEGPLLTFFNRLSTFEAVAEEIRAKDLRAIERACDIYLFLGDQDEAEHVIEDGIREATEFKLADVVSELEFRREKVMPKLQATGGA